MNLEKYLEEKRIIIDNTLNKILPEEGMEPAIIHQAMRYSVFSGGKRLRPFLALMTAEILGEKWEKVIYFACGIELIHTFSLIHDDLPSIDNDDFRRGKPSCHKVFGEDIAILTGDALMILGIQAILKNEEIKGIKKSTVLKVLKELTHYLGTENLLGGQIEDITMQEENATREGFFKLYEKKTASLICATIRGAALLCAANKEELKALTKYGQNIGLSFQITDDILDLMQDQREMKKYTYPHKFGLKESRKIVENLIQEAKKSIKIFGEKSAMLNSLADYILSREK